MKVSRLFIAFIIVWIPHAYALHKELIQLNTSKNTLLYWICFTLVYLSLASLLGAFKQYENDETNN